MRNIYTSPDGKFLINVDPEGDFVVVIHHSPPSTQTAVHMLFKEEARKAFRNAEKEFLGGLG